MKRVGKPWFFILVLLMAAATCLSVFGVTTQFGDIKTTSIRGLFDVYFLNDIDNEYDVVLTVKTDEDGAPISDSDFDTAAEMVKARLSFWGVTGAKVYPDRDTGNIFVRFPWWRGLSDDSLMNIMGDLVRKGEFKIYDSTEMDVNGLPTGNVLLSTEHLDVAEPLYDSESSKPILALTFNEEGTTILEEQTEAHQGDTFSVWLDDTLIAAPTIDSTLSSGNIVLSKDSFTVSEVIRLANLFNGGIMPIDLVETASGGATPLYGQNAMMVLWVSVIILLLAVQVIFASRYKVLGWLLAFSILFQAACLLGVMSGFFTFFSPLTVDMPIVVAAMMILGSSVYANVVVCEAIRAEQLAGKVVRTSYLNGFGQKMAVVTDISFVMLIIGLALRMGSGSSSGLGALLYWLLSKIGSTGSIELSAVGAMLIGGAIISLITNLLINRMLALSTLEFKSLGAKSIMGGERNA